MSLNNRLLVSSCKQDKNLTVSINKIKSGTMNKLRNDQKKTEPKFKTGDKFININDFLLKFRVEMSKNKVKFLVQKEILNDYYLVAVKKIVVSKSLLINEQKQNFFTLNI
ncbi:hypothetical protein CDIK_3806 [Cucumispora dikerogammari]|nr:hypothetical protein CDIK_3806 [Cucumispora dikerogammari]